MSFGRKTCRVAVRHQRIWRLKLAIAEVLRRGKVSDSALRCIIGHAAWIAMVRRECLSILAAVYAFVQWAGGGVRVLWSSVARELRWLSSVLPLRFADLQRPWCKWMYATDAERPSASSYGGYGAVRRHLPASTC